MILTPYKKGGHIQWTLATHVVYFEDNGLKGSKHTCNLSYWDEFEALHKDNGFRITQRRKVTWTEEQHQRLEDIQGYPEGYSDIYIDYVVYGDVKRVKELPHDHPMQLLARDVVQAQTDEQMLDLYIEIDMMRGGFNE